MMDAEHRGSIRDWLLECERPEFGVWSTRILLLFTVAVAASPIEFSAGPRAEDAATIFSWLPEGWIRSGELFLVARVATIGSAMMWALRIAVPVSCWTTVLAAWFYWAMRMENLTNGAHIFNVTSMLLLIHAAWWHWYHRPIRDALQSPLLPAACYPRWVLFLCVFYLGWFHSLAGFTKIAESGWGWGNGVSLQLWTELFGWDPSPFGRLLRWDSRLTAVMQTGALIIECASVLAVFHRWIRYGVGLGLFGFYLGVLTTFVTFGFHFNAILVFWFLLPVDRWGFGMWKNSRWQNP